jgi:hypothetical protein
MIRRLWTCTTCWSIGARILGVGEHVIALDTDKLVYLKDRNLLVTQFSKEEIQALPNEAPAHG